VIQNWNLTNGTFISCIDDCSQYEKYHTIGNLYITSFNRISVSYGNTIFIYDHYHLLKKFLIKDFRCFIMDGDNRFITGSDTIQLWDIGNEKFITTEVKIGTHVSAMCGDGIMLVTSDHHGSVNIRDFTLE